MSDPAPAAARAIGLSALFDSGPPPERAAARCAAELAQARKAGRADAETELLPRIAALQERLADRDAAHAASLARTEAQAADMIAAIQAALATDLAALGVAVARRAIGAEPALAGATIAGLIGEALSGLPAGDIGTLRLHPAHLDVAAGLLPSGWAIVADPALAAGEVVADSGPALSAASLEIRLAQMLAALEAQP